MSDTNNKENEFNQNIINSLIEKINTLTIDQQRYLLCRLEDLLFSEKRKYKRVKCNIDVDLSIDGKYYKNKIKDISLGGAFIETDAPIEEGKQVLLNVNDQHNRTQMQIKCMIIRKTDYGAGVSFIADSKQQKMKLKSLMKSIEK